MRDCTWNLSPGSGQAHQGCGKSSSISRLLSSDSHVTMLPSTEIEIRDRFRLQWLSFSESSTVDLQKKLVYRIPDYLSLVLTSDPSFRPYLVRKMSKGRFRLNV